MPRYEIIETVTSHIEAESIEAAMVIWLDSADLIPYFVSVDDRSITPLDDDSEEEGSEF
jgi:hypothetical protein